MLAKSLKPGAHDKVLDDNPDQTGIKKCWFTRRGETWSTQGKTSRTRVENHQQTQPTCEAGSGNQTWDTLVGGECSHHYGNPAPLSWCGKLSNYGKQPLDSLSCKRNTPLLLTSEVLSYNGVLLTACWLLDCLFHLLEVLARSSAAETVPLSKVD